MTSATMCRRTWMPIPMVKAELTGIRQPLVDLKNRCGDTNGDGIADS